jgi:hypothetical protein
VSNRVSEQVMPYSNEFPLVELRGHRVGAELARYAGPRATAGIGFAAVLDDVRRARAEAMLANGELDLAEIAFELGYSEHSAFMRAASASDRCQIASTASTISDGNRVRAAGSPLARIPDRARTVVGFNKSLHFRQLNTAHSGPSPAAFSDLQVTDSKSIRSKTRPWETYRIRVSAPTTIWV